jgi:LysM repeat protein
MTDQPKSYYTIRPGDTFHSLASYTTGSNDTMKIIAQRFYSDANKWPVLRDKNPPLQQYNGDQILPAGIAVTY